MSQITYRFSLGLDAQLQISSAIDKQVFPMLHQAVRAIAKQAATDWQAAVYGAKLWSGEKDQYASSIGWSMTGDFSAVVEATYEQASNIETGRPARDLKKMLNTSSKVRRTEDGRRFLIIPFRHNTPGNGAHAKPMPAGVFKLAKAIETSKVVGSGLRPAGEVTHLSPKTGMHASGKQTPFASNPVNKAALMTARRDYQWGGKLTRGGLKHAGMDAATRKRYAGLVRMDTSTPGGAKSSSYMTFRVMIEGSSGWIAPAQPGLYLARGVVQSLQPKAAAAFSEAIKRTLGA